jgi:fido (protein-threonine AMPylation protein)
MMLTTDPLGEPADGTPLTDQERHGLRLPVLTRNELNRAEADNISQAMTWLFFSRRRLRPEAVTREAWLKRLHWRMYHQVWAWQASTGRLKETLACLTGRYAWTCATSKPMPGLGWPTQARHD